MSLRLTKEDLYPPILLVGEYLSSSGGRQGAGSKRSGSDQDPTAETLLVFMRACAFVLANYSGIVADPADMKAAQRFFIGTAYGAAPLANIQQLVSMLGEILPQKLIESSISENQNTAENAASEMVNPSLVHALPLAAGCFDSTLDLAANAGAYAFVLVDIYERILDISLEKIADIYPKKSCSTVRIITNGDTRKKSGSYYTPIRMCNRVVDKALDRLIYAEPADGVKRLKLNATADLLSLKFLDPAMGGGAFLLAIVQKLIAVYERISCNNGGGPGQSFTTDLREHSNGVGEMHASPAGWAGRRAIAKQLHNPLKCPAPTARREQREVRLAIARNCIYGVDLDPLACSVAKLALWLFCVDKDSYHEIQFDFLDDQLKCGDSLTARRLRSKHVNQLSCNDGETRTSTDTRKLPFNWQREFSKVFNAQSGGFNAVISNPPWQVDKPNSNAYKLFLEAGYSLVKVGGVMSMLIPSGFYTDKSTSALRNLFLDRSDLYCIEGFINRDRAFPIHSSFAYCLIALQKGAVTKHINVSFGNSSKALVGAAKRDKPGKESSSKALVHAADRGMSGKESSSKALTNATDRPVKYERKDVHILSPKWNTILEIGDKRDLDVLKKLYKHGIALGASAEGGWHIKFKREFDMTNSAPLFIPIQKAIKDGFVADQFGNWVKGDSILYPLYEGRMIGQFDLSEKCYVSGRARRAIWQNQALPNVDSDACGSNDAITHLHEYTDGVGAMHASPVGWAGRRAIAKQLPSPLKCPAYAKTDARVDDSGSNIEMLLNRLSKRIGPQFLMSANNFLSSNAGNSGAAETAAQLIKVGYLAVGSATNVRTMIATCLPDVPCGNSVPVFHGMPPAQALALTACLNSFVFDYALRLRMTGNNLNYYLLEECPLPYPSQLIANRFLLQAVASLSLNHVRFAGLWSTLASTDNTALRIEWAVDAYERLRLRCIIDALVAWYFQLGYEEYSWILFGFAAPNIVSRSSLPDSANSPKGFWRIDKQLPVQLRQPCLALSAYKNLLELGIDKFIYQNDGKSWQPPESCINELILCGVGCSNASRRTAALHNSMLQNSALHNAFADQLKLQQALSHLQQKMLARQARHLASKNNALF